MFGQMGVGATGYAFATSELWIPGTERHKAGYEDEVLFFMKPETCGGLPVFYLLQGLCAGGAA